MNGAVMLSLKTMTKKRKHGSDLARLDQSSSELGRICDVFQTNDKIYHISCGKKCNVRLYMALKSHVAAVQRRKNDRAAFRSNILYPGVDQGICRKHVLQRRQAFFGHDLVGYGWHGCMGTYGYHVEGHRQERTLSRDLTSKNEEGSAPRRHQRPSNDHGVFTVAEVWGAGNFIDFNNFK